MGCNLKDIAPAQQTSLKELAGKRVRGTQRSPATDVQRLQATLRLQTMLGVSLSKWEELQPTDDKCLTQLGGCVVVGPGGEALYSWLDQGLCDLPDFDEMVEAL